MVARNKTQIVFFLQHDLRLVAAAFEDRRYLVTMPVVQRGRTRPASHVQQGGLQGEVIDDCWKSDEPSDYA